MLQASSRFSNLTESPFAPIFKAMAMVAFPFGTSMPWDIQMENSQPAQPGLIAMRTIPLDGSQVPLSTNLPHLLGPSGVLHPKEDTDEGSDEWYEEGRHPEEAPRTRVRKSESRGLNLGKIPMAPGRVSNPGMAWFNKQTCEQLQEQLQGASDVSSAVEALVGHVWDLSRHPLGCRLVQTAMERSSQKQAAILAGELRGHVQEAMTSPHANYVLQKMVTHLTWHSCSFVAEELQGDSASHYARHRFGCRIFCRLIEFHSDKEPTLMLVEEVLQEAEDLCCHPFGHHVAQSVLEHGSEEHREIVSATIDRNPLGYARNQNASYLVERVLASNSRYQESLLAELSSCLEDIALSRYGCYVARAVVEHPKTNRPLEISKLTAIRSELNKTKHGQYLLADLGLSQKHGFKKYAH
eukprot:Skav219367  [mRNA]  locus=scaffold76:609536:611115:- [translate_table: standard]